MLYLVGGIVAVAIILFVVAVVQGREVAFYPSPKIGAKAPKTYQPPADRSPNSGQTASMGLSPDTSQRGRSIAGIWLCQYKHSRLDEKAGCKVMTIETDLVRLEQGAAEVKGATIFALAHLEDLEGRITGDRYFTGLYFNQLNHQSYHGALQYSISHSKDRMVGRWAGFNREDNEVDSEEWRWERIDDSPQISEVKRFNFVRRARETELFALEPFL